MKIGDLYFTTKESKKLLASMKYFFSKMIEKVKKL